MQQFNIVQNATLPYLEMEVINDGRHNFNKIYVALQAADVTFNMIDNNNGIKKIVNKKCNIVPIEGNGCIEKVKVQYQWCKNDTREKGQFKGYFKVSFKDDIAMEDMMFPKGDLIVPIAEELIINVISLHIYNIDNNI